MPAKQHRILRGEDFRHIVRRGSRVGGASCITHAVLHVETTRTARFGFIVTKAVGNAVTRNLLRRRLKTIVDHYLAAGLTGMDVVFRVLPHAATIPFHELERDVDQAMKKIMRMQVEAISQSHSSQS